MSIILSKIISGGQTGADQGGLAAAKSTGLETGGTAPPGYLTENGPHPELLRDCYGLTEGEPDIRNYPKRTKKNIADSDGTVIFGNTGSRGSRLTLSYCTELDKPFILNPNTDELIAFIERHSIKVLNVAGNRASHNPFIYTHVRDTIIAAVERMRVE